MNIVDFTRAHISEAASLSFVNYEEEHRSVPALPPAAVIPDLTCFTENGLGVSAFEDDRLIGFLCCWPPIDHAFGTSAKGVFSPIHAHGAIKENRALIYRQMYQAAAEKWVSKGITSHAVALYAHDSEAVKAFFINGFGLRCVDAIRPMEKISIPLTHPCEFRELSKNKVGIVREMRLSLTEHLSASPCFMYSLPADVESWLARVEGRNTRVFAAFDRSNAANGKPVAFVEIAAEGENFATVSPDMRNICGAFCLPEYRGKGIYQNLLDYTIYTLKAQGFTRLGVDFESFNPTAHSFWLKYFTAYTNSVVRRIDENILNRK